jgi:hypothetical protein
MWNLRERLKKQEEEKQKRPLDPLLPFGLRRGMRGQMFNTNWSSFFIPSLSSGNSFAKDPGQGNPNVGHCDFSLLRKDSVNNTLSPEKQCRFSISTQPGKTSIIRTGPP